MNAANQRQYSLIINRINRDREFPENPEKKKKKKRNKKKSNSERKYKKNNTNVFTRQPKKRATVNINTRKTIQTYSQGNRNIKHQPKPNNNN